jgi:LPXTG-motif cell wall-anchored protein
MSRCTPGPWRVILDDTGGEFTGWPTVAGIALIAAWFVVFLLTIGVIK